MYNDYYFRFSDEVSAEQALIALNAFASIDRVGTVHDASGAPVAGWHVNVRLKDGSAIPAAMVACQIDAPLHPKRVWESENESVA